MFTNISFSVTGPTAKADSAVGTALRIWKQTGRDEKLVALMNSMHKTGVGFREVEDAVAKTQWLKYTSDNQFSSFSAHGRYDPGRRKKDLDGIPRDEEAVEDIMKLQRATTDWKKGLAEKKKLREDLVAEFGGERKRKFKKTMRMLTVEEEREKSIYQKRYLQNQDFIRIF